MRVVFDIQTYFLLFGSFLCFLASVLLFVNSIKGNIHNRWLSLYYFAIGFVLFGSFLLYSHFIEKYPWYYLYRIPFIGALIFMPLSLIYIRSLLLQRPFKRFDLIHFIPVMVYIIDLFPLFFFKSGDYKLQSSIASEDLSLVWKSYTEGWIGIGQRYVAIRIIQGTVYWIWQIRILIQVTRMENKMLFVKENAYIISWARVFCGLQILFFLPFYVYSLIGSNALFFSIQTVSVAIVCSITVFALLLRPEILYGLKGKWLSSQDIYSALDIDKEPNSDTAVDIKKVQEEMVPDNSQHYEDLNQIFLEEQQEVEFSEDYPALVFKNASPNGRDDLSDNKKQRYLPFEKMKEADIVILSHIMAKKPYLNGRYSAHYLSVETGIQLYLISAVLSQIHKMHFTDFINQFRVKHAITLLDSGEGKFFTLEALAFQSGFSNRNTFTAAFKKHAQKTPSAYIKNLSAN